MKSILYVGATLMIGASIYGFVDYKQTHNKKEFKEMYSEKKTTAPVVAPVEEVVVPAEPEKKAIVSTKKSSSKKKGVAKKEAYVPVEPIAEDDKMVAEEIVITEEPIAQPEPVKESSVLKTVKKKKVRREFFSRGRMPDEEVKLAPTKKDTKKTESKSL